MGSACAGEKYSNLDKLMHKTWLILKNEIITVITRPSYLLTIFGIPLGAALIFAFVSYLNQDQTTSSVITQIVSGPQQQEVQGYVDQSGIITSIPTSLPPDYLVAFESETSAQAALSSGEISSYYLISDDYLQTGRITYIRPDFNPLSSADQSGLIEWILRVNLLDGDERLATFVNGPIQLEEVSLASEPQRDQDDPLTFFLPYAVTMIFYIVIMGAASLLLSSVTKEKENRMLEILMISVTPLQMLTGKIIGLGLVGLLQTVVWLGTGRLLLSRGSSVLSISEAFQLPISFLLWGLVFFVLGYALYASLMSAIGALVPNMREASQTTMVIALPLILPLFFISVLVEEPHGALSVFLSFFPLTAPVAMMTRLAAGSVPPWQLLLSALLLALTVMLIVRLVAGMFHAQTLLSGQEFSLKRYFKVLLGRA
jgi:ABC-2 type transport system permease protein